MCDADFTVQGGYFACARIVNGWTPTAIVAANDLMAIGAMHCCWDRSFRISDDLSIVGFDDITFAEYTQPSLTTVHVPRARIGTTAFESLWQMLRRDQLVVSPAARVRDSDWSQPPAVVVFAAVRPTHPSRKPRQLEISPCL